MNEIKFSNNWNNKLDCDYYTSIRVRSEKYVVGNVFKVFLKNTLHHEAELIRVIPISLDNINDLMAYIDAGMDSIKLRYMLSKMYYHKVDIDKEVFVYLLFEKSKTSQKDKIALFCNAYKNHYGIIYTPTRGEVGMIKKIEVNEALLDAYFKSTEWWAKTKSIAYYCKNINPLKALLVAPAPSKYPNHYSRDFEAKLSTNELSDYWQHLRSLGLKAVKNSIGKTIDWK